MKKIILALAVVLFLGGCQLDKYYELIPNTEVENEG